MSIMYIINMIASMLTEMQWAATVWFFTWITIFLSSFIIYTEENLTLVANILAIYVWEPWVMMYISLPSAQTRFIYYYVATHLRNDNTLTFSMSCFLLLVACIQIFLFYKVTRAFLKGLILFAPRPSNTANDISISAYLTVATHQVLQKLGLDLYIPKFSPSTIINLNLLFWTTSVALCAFLATTENLSATILYLAYYMDPLEPWLRHSAATAPYPTYAHLIADKMLIQRAYELPYNKPLTITLVAYRICLSVATVITLYKFSMTLEIVCVQKWNEGKANRKLMEMVKIILDENDIDTIDVYVRRTRDMKGLMGEAWFNWRNDIDPLEY